jgi:putative transposase
VEGLFFTMKLETGLDEGCEGLRSPHQLQRELAFWIDEYYNHDRLHSRIGDLSPIDYEQQFIAAHTLTPVNP